MARALRDAGIEVVYTGLHQTPEQIVEAAIQEDADVVGLSVLSGAHMTLFARVVELLRERDAADIVVFGGGIIPDDDMPELERAGRRQGLHARCHDDGDRRLGAGATSTPTERSVPRLEVTRRLREKRRPRTGMRTMLMPCSNPMMSRIPPSRKTSPW